ncbi:hypothetical protein BC827DRAFT_132567 [Russula dissimulans]|nr:hypothetical protein BC827DRAFT_132567 [Russula dissimulans]
MLPRRQHVHLGPDAVLPTQYLMSASCYPANSTVPPSLPPSHVPHPSPQPHVESPTTILNPAPAGIRAPPPAAKIQPRLAAPDRAPVLARDADKGALPRAASRRARRFRVRHARRHRRLRRGHRASPKRHRAALPEPRPRQRGYARDRNRELLPLLPPFLFVCLYVCLFVVSIIGIRIVYASCVKLAVFPYRLTLSLHRRRRPLRAVALPSFLRKRCRLLFPVKAHPSSLPSPPTASR